MIQQTPFLIGLQKNEQIQNLHKYAKSVSENCHKFSIQFLKVRQQYKKMPNDTPPPDYLQLLRSIFHYRKQITPRGLCAKILVEKTYAFKCLQCQNQDNSIICIECFNNSDHKGHPYQKIVVYGGCCDCGDDEKWKIQGSCFNHNKKITHVDTDPDQTEKFIKQMKFVLYLIFTFGFFPINMHKQHLSWLLVAFAKFLKAFNQESIVSNEMTFLLFKSEFENYPKIKHADKSFKLRISVFAFLLRHYNYKQFSRILIDLWIIMFTRQQFRKYLTFHYNNTVYNKPLILSSQLSNISCQIFTSHRVIAQLIDSKQFPPLRIPQHIPLPKFEQVCSIYSRYYVDLLYLSNLYNNVGEKYMNYHFQEGDVVEISGYEDYVRAEAENDGERPVQYYGMEYIMFSRCMELFKYMGKNKEVLLKSIKDVVTYLSKQKNNATINYFIPKERTFIVLAMIYFDGNIEDAASSDFLTKINMSQSCIFRMLQAVLYVIRFYAINIANRQTAERYYTFYSFSVGKKPKILLSLDFLLVKFCFLALEKYSEMVNQNMKPTNVLYEETVTFEQNHIPLVNLIALPTKFIKNVLSYKIKENQEGLYDRTKALRTLIEYIGLLNELICTNNAQLCIRTVFNVNKNQQYKEKLIKFYGGLLRNLESIKLDQFKQICNLFLHDDTLVLEKFVKQYCLIDNKKIKLKPQRESSFQQTNMTYLKSIKCVQTLIPYITVNEKKVSLAKIPTHEHQEKINQTLKNQIFNQYFIDQIFKVADLYLMTMDKYPKLMETDPPLLSRFVEEIIRLNYLLKNKTLYQILDRFESIEILFKKFPQNIQVQLSKVMGKQKIQPLVMEQQINHTKNDEEKLQKMKDAKAKKLQKMKSKQLKALDSFKSEQPSSMKDQAQQSTIHPFCMFCKLGQTEEPLSILCFTQKSNLFSQKFLGCSRRVSLITTCNHFAHESCNKTVNQIKEYIHCNFCKTSSNLLLETNLKNKQVKQEKPKTLSSSSKLLGCILKTQKRKSSVFNHSFDSKQQLVHDQLQQQEKLSKQQSQIETIALSIVYGTVIDYNFFVRSLSKVCCFLITNLATTSKQISINNLISEINQEIANSIVTEQNQLYWNAYKFTILSVSTLLALERENTDKRWDIRYLQENLPEAFVNSISAILSALKNMESLKLLEQNKIQLQGHLQIRKLPEQLSQLSTQIGDCPSCGRVTNEIALCMLCPFKTCVGCTTTNLTKHSIQAHGQASVYVRVDEGWIIYVSGKKNRVYDSLYHNFMGEFFSLGKNDKKKSDYKLEATGYNKIKNDIVRNRIEQEIRYSEINTNVSSTIVP